MKLQALSIIFIIIIFPVILVLSYYLGLQIDTVALQNKYNNALIDATNDAMEAFEMNTANEELSQVSDSLRTIIDASTNIFMNTFSTSLGMSNTNKENIQPYIPSILYTMYDGYYIYAPTKTPIILEKKVTVNGITTSDGYAVVGDEGVVKVTGTDGYRYIPGAPATFDVDDVGALLYKVQGNDVYTTQINANTEYKTDYVLKSYMPYSATYNEAKTPGDQNGNLRTDDMATINYTLDNYISVSANIGDVYYTKSGYYIKDNLVNFCDISDWENMGQDELLEFCKSGQTVKIILHDGTEIEYTAKLKDPGDASSFISIEELEKELDLLYKRYQSGESVLSDIQNLEFELANNKAITYYLTNIAFSKWVNSNLGFVTGNNLETVIDFTDLKGYSEEYLESIYHNFAGDITTVFSAGNDPENEDSAFNNHKYNIIKNSIQYNLNLSISSYNKMFQAITFEMPLIEDEKFQEITRKISIVSFAQGLDCGLKTYNGYAIISSTNNEMTVLPEEIYYVSKSEFNDGQSEYHRLDCESLSWAEYISFKSKEVKYDDIFKGDTAANKYEYDHKNLACYDCIVQNNYTNYYIPPTPPSIIGEKKRIKLRAFLGLETDDTEEGDFKTDPLTPQVLNLRKAYYIAVAKERQNLYKTTGYSKNEGINITNLGTITWPTNATRAEVTLKYKGTVPGIVGKIWIGGTEIDKYISLATTTNQTIVISRNEATAGGNIQCKVAGASPEEQNIEVLSIKYIYK